MQAVEVAREGGFDGFVGLGGGSSIDTAKIAALLATHPGGIYDYLNPPIGKGTPVPGPLLPLFGVPRPAAPVPRRRRSRSSTCPSTTSRRASRTPTCARCSASSTPT